MTLESGADNTPFDIGFGEMVADAAVMKTGRVPLEVYTSQERFDREREIFGRVWLNVAESAELPRAGDWVVREVKVRSASVILIRGKDMTIRAFHNMCSHRGMKLVWDQKGRGGRFSCPYHAWTYNALGELVNVPDEGCFSEVDKKESGLTAISCDVWEGLVFINLDPKPRQTLEEFLGPLTQRLKNLPFASYPYTARVGSVIHANWKLAIEAQCEAYHVRVLHSRTVSKMLSSRDNPFVHPIHTEFFGAHRMGSVPRNPEYELPVDRLVQGFSFRNAAQMVIADTGTGACDQPAFSSHPDVNQRRSDVWGNDQYVLYPHFIFHVSLGGWWLHRFWPLAPGKTYWEAVYHFERPTSLRNQFAIQYSLALNRDTLMEDNLALVQQQEVMESGARKLVQFGTQEILCKHLAAVSEAIASASWGSTAAAQPSNNRRQQTRLVQPARSAL
jgi:phenylpropionate dioxygenase-like ring-hydroxylating dioxygenase large terminal subunit